MVRRICCPIYNTHRCIIVDRLRSQIARNFYDDTVQNVVFKIMQKNEIKQKSYRKFLCNPDKQCRCLSHCKRWIWNFIRFQHTHTQHSPITCLHCTYALEKLQFYSFTTVCRKKTNKKYSTLIQMGCLRSKSTMRLPSTQTQAQRLSDLS